MLLNYSDSKLFFKRMVQSVTVSIMVFISATAKAGFLDMPDTTEVPEFERESLLLDMDIPEVRDRDPNPEAGPRLNVKEFRVQGLVEYPELNITRAEIVKRIEAIRFDMMGEGKFLESGYTIDEIEKVSDLIAEIEKETEGRHVGSVEVQKLVFLIREQRRQRGITLGMIETVADTITRYYRERGFILAKAYIPKQHVRDGVVTITLLLGELGEIALQNNKRYSDALLKRVFKNALAKPVTNDTVEENLYLINDLPGLVVSGYFEPGSQVGDTKLNVNVNAERWYDANLRFDNHGSDKSGEYRAYADFALNNPLGIGDELHLGVLGAFEPEDATYGSLRYSLPIATPRVWFSTGVSTNDFLSVTDDKSTYVLGESLLMDASVNYKLSRSRLKNHTIGFGYSEIDSEINYEQNGVNLEAVFDSNTAKNTELFYEFDLLAEKSQVLHQGRVGIISSKYVDDVNEDPDVDTSPIILTFDYSKLSFTTIPFTKKRSKMILRASGQYSEAALAVVSKSSLAGPMRARGFAINEYSADDALFLGADLILDDLSFGGLTLGNQKVENIFQPFIFLDVAYGKSNPFDSDAENDSSEAHLIDAGVGLKVGFKDSLSGNLVLAHPLDAKNSALEAQERDEDLQIDTVPGDGLKVYFDFQIKL